MKSVLLRVNVLVRRRIFHGNQISSGFDIQRIKYAPQLTPENMAQINEYMTLWSFCFMIPQLYKNYTTRCVSPFLLEVCFLLVRTDFYGLPQLPPLQVATSIAVSRRDMILEDEALTHARLLPKNSTFTEEHVELPSFFCPLLLFSFFAY